MLESQRKRKKAEIVKELRIFCNFLNKMPTFYLNIIAQEYRTFKDPSYGQIILLQNIAITCTQTIKIRETFPSFVIIISRIDFTPFYVKLLAFFLSVYI